jgi:hypothetical protein
VVHISLCEISILFVGKNRNLPTYLVIVHIISLRLNKCHGKAFAI